VVSTVAAEQETTVATPDLAVQVVVSAGSVKETVDVVLEATPLASTLPPITTGRRGASDIITLRIQQDGKSTDAIAANRPLRIRIEATEELVESAAGDLRNAVVQRQDPVSGRWEDLPTRIDEATGQIVAETSKPGRLIVSVPGPPPQAGETLTVLVPSKERVLAPPPMEDGPPPPVLIAPPGTTDRIVNLVYTPKVPQQLPLPPQGQMVVGQAFQLEAYHLDQRLPAFSFAGTLDIYVPFSRDLLDVVEGDASRFTLCFYDEEATPPAWTPLPTEVLSDGLHAQVNHLSLFTLVASVEEGQEVASGETPILRPTAAVFFASAYDRTMSLERGDVVTITLLLDAGGTPVGKVDVTVLIPEKLVEVVNIDTAGSICDVWSAAPVVEPGHVTIACAISGPGYAGIAAPVAELTLRMKSGGLATLSFASDSRVLAQEQPVDILGIAQEMVLAIEREVPPVIYPEPVPLVALEEGGLGWGGITAIMVGVMAALATGAAAVWRFLWRPQRQEPVSPSGGMGDSERD